MYTPPPPYIFARGNNGAKRTQQIFELFLAENVCFKKGLWEKQSLFADTTKGNSKRQQQIKYVTDRITTYSMDCTVIKNNDPGDEKQISILRECTGA